MFRRIAFVLFLFSVIITCDTTELATATELNNDDVVKAQELEKALIGQSNNLSDANEGEKMKVRDSFNKALEGKLKKRFDMNINDKIEKRALNRVQINHILDVLINNKHNEKNYYNFRNTYSVQTIDGTNYLYENQENKRNKAKTNEKKTSNPNAGRIVPLEDMFDVCLKVHKDTGLIVEH